MNATPLLLPFDGSSDALHAVRLVAGWRDAPITPLLLNVRPSLPHFWPRSWVSEAALDAVVAEQGREILEPARALLADAGLMPETRALVGATASRVVEAADDADAAAIVMSTRGQGVVSAPGSVALRVAHLSALPLLVTPRDCRLPEAPGRVVRVLLAVDGSRHADAAARWLARAGWLGKRRVDVVYAQNALTLADAMLGPREQVIEHWSGRLGEEICGAARATLAAAGIAYEQHTLTGDPGPELARFAREREADFIVLGTRGLGAVGRALLGSTALQLARLSSVLI